MQPDSLEVRLYKIAKRMFLSTFVVVSFVAYVVHEKFVSLTNPEPAAVQSDIPTKPTAPLAVATPQNGGDDEDQVSPPSVFQPLPTQAAPTNPPSQAPTQSPPTAIPTDVPATQGQYKDGVYTGPTVDAYYGLVQVQATVQNGQIAAVDFLQFPQDRRTSQRINAVAVPYLKMEAVQTQSANVNIISGATLTSEAFTMSLQSALDSAKR